MKKLVLLVALVLGFGGMSAQNICGTQDVNSITDRLLKNRAFFEKHVFQRGGITYVPIQFHILGESDGGGYIRETEVFNGLCNLNEQFTGSEIQFYLYDHFNYINNTVAFQNPRSITASLTFEGQRSADALNVFIPLNAEFNNSGGGTVLGYYDPQTDWIVIRKANMNGSPSVSTFGHEVGHFLSLPHTFNGWENSCSDQLGYCSSEHGNPVGITSPNGVPNERQNGSNGATAGDFISDTSPNYLFGLRWGDCSPFTVPVMDPTGTVVDPQENNFMSYFANCSDFDFTAGQITVMKQDLASPGRAFLDTDYTPPATQITEDVELFPPFSQNTNQGEMTDIEFSWSDVPGATRYMIQIARNPGFTLFLQQYFTTNTSLTVGGFTAGQGTWYWRVKPYNEYYTCADFVSDNFVPGENTSALDPIKGLESFIVVPNPMAVNGSAIVHIETNELLNASIIVYDMLGSAVMHKNAGSFTGSHEVQLSGFTTPGLYIVMLNTDKGQAVKKLVVN